MRQVKATSWQAIDKSETRMGRQAKSSESYQRVAFQRAVFAALVGLAGIAASVQRHASAQVVIDPVKEYNLKAAYLYAFGRYVQWPESEFSTPNDPVVIGVIGMDPFGARLQKIERSKRIHGRPVKVQRFNSSSSYQTCHILFVSGSLSEVDQQNVLRSVDNRSVLIVGETPGFALQGGVLGFVISGEKVRFEMNLAAARQRGLQVDAKLQSLATIVNSNQSNL